jgi:hypothetical protein
VGRRRGRLNPSAHAAITNPHHVRFACSSVPSPALLLDPSRICAASRGGRFRDVAGRHVVGEPHAVVGQLELVTVGVHSGSVDGEHDVVAAPGTYLVGGCHIRGRVCQKDCVSGVA